MLAEGNVEQQTKGQQCTLGPGQQQSMAAPAGKMLSAGAAAAAAVATDALGGSSGAGVEEQLLQAAAVPAELHPVLVVPRVRAKKKIGTQQ
jgi:hypothetical protein